VRRDSAAIYVTELPVVFTLYVMLANVCALKEPQEMLKKAAKLWDNVKMILTVLSTKFASNLARVHVNVWTLAANFSVDQMHSVSQKTIDHLVFA
jgi:hypothetical protein